MLTIHWTFLEIIDSRIAHYTLDISRDNESEPVTALKLFAERLAPIENEMFKTAMQNLYGWMFSDETILSSLSLRDQFQFLENAENTKKLASNFIDEYTKALLDYLEKVFGDKQAVKVAFDRYKMSKSGRRRFDNALLECTKQMVLPFAIDHWEDLPPNSLVVPYYEEDE